MLLYPPTDRPMREEYPELSRREAFGSDVISDEELRFSWYWANPTSDLYSEPTIIVKVNKCFDRSFKKPNPTLKAQYLTQNFPLNLIEAFTEWRMMNPSMRMKTLRALKKTFDNHSKMLDEDVPTDDAKKKEYIERTIKISQNLPQLMREIEEGFGMREKKDVIDDSLFENMMKETAN